MATDTLPGRRAYRSAAPPCWRHLLQKLGSRKVAGGTFTVWLFNGVTNADCDRIGQQLLNETVQAYRWRIYRDSLTAVAVRTKIRQDSLEAVAEAEASSTRFVNATKLNLRDEPSASSPARVVVLLGSSVEVLKRLSSGWWQVYVDGYQGYLRADFLVPTLNSITVPGANIGDLKEAEGSTYVERIPLKPQAQGKRRVYICAGQYAYAYHSRDVCAGLNNCRAGVYYTTEYKAQDMGRSPCGRCFD